MGERTINDWSLIGLELFIESIGLLGDNRQPLLHAIQKFIKRLEKKD